MTRVYTPYFQSLNVGDDIDVAGVKFYCLIPCFVIGYANDDKQVVIEDGEGGIKEVTTELVEAGDYPTKPQPGMARIANLYLGKYKRIDIGELSGKTVAKTGIRDGSFIVLCIDDTYVKMESDVGRYTSEKTLRDKLLTIDDLRTLDLVHEVDWGFHLWLVQKARKKRQKIKDEQRLAEIITRLGKGRAREILEDSP